MDARNRYVEERRRAENLLKVHDAWANRRRIGGVGEPRNPVGVTKAEG